MKEGNTVLQLSLGLPTSGDVAGSRLGGGSAPLSDPLRATCVAPSLEPATSPAVVEPPGLRRARERRQLGLDVGERKGRHRWNTALSFGFSWCAWCGLERWTRARLELDGFTRPAARDAQASALRLPCQVYFRRLDSDDFSSERGPCPGVLP